MKQFFKFVFASMVGVILAGIVLAFIGFILVVAIVAGASNDKKTDVEPNSILRIALNYPITERTPNNPLAGLLNNDDKSIGLKDILANIKKAKTDNNIKGIFLDESAAEAGQASIEEIRNALIDFKTSHKFIIAYSEAYSQSAYYLASVADKVYLNPKGALELHGFSSQVTFVKGALDKLGVEAEIIKVGTFKSAVEPLILTKMSDPNRKQVTEYVGSMYNHFLDGISKTRDINRDTLFNIANDMRVREPEDALKYKLVDGLMYKDEILAQLRSKLGVAQKSDIKAVEISDYTKSDMSSDDDDSKAGTSDGRIAMIYASGEISGGEGDDNSIGSEGISKALRKARTDSKIKAVVFRVNSPGGSALASEVIWREVELTKKVKPIVVSMGDVAASGGYYISCAADSIIAEPNTITGSIGIFSVLFNMQKLFNDKLGVTFDGVKTGKFADIGDMSRPLTAQERFILQTQINHGYDTFTGRVAAGRHKTKAYIDSIGQGRVWTGEQALKIGLVDRLGNIDDAVKCAAKMAHVKSYRLVSYPEQKSFLNKLGLTTSTELKTYLVKSELGPNYKLYQKLQSVTQMARAPQARMLYDVEVN